VPFSFALLHNGVAEGKNDVQTEGKAQ
jgi:hypothetical protein